MIEAQLGHCVPGRLGMAYNCTQHIDERKCMVKAWSDYLDELKAMGSMQFGFGLSAQRIVVPSHQSNT